jgi:ATP-binding cassette subfamily F protein uup
LAALPAKIEALEIEQKELQNLVGHGDFYRQGSGKITASIERLESIGQELEVCYGRWQELESLASSTKS